VVKLKVYGETVTLEGGEWTGASEAVLPDLETMAEYLTLIREPPGDYVPDTDLLIARGLIELVGATILKYDAPDLPKGTVA
jgi:hypothetical protein